MNTVILHTNADVAAGCRFKINSNTTWLTTHSWTINHQDKWMHKMYYELQYICTILGFWKAFLNEKQTIGINSRT